MHFSDSMYHDQQLLENSAQSSHVESLGDNDMMFEDA